MDDLSETERACLRAEIFAILEKQKSEKRMEAKARRLLRRRALLLHKSRSGRFTVVDHIGSVDGAPYGSNISDVLSWIEATAQDG